METASSIILNTTHPLFWILQSATMTQKKDPLVFGLFLKFAVFIWPTGISSENETEGIKRRSGMKQNRNKSHLRQLFAYFSCYSSYSLCVTACQTHGTALHPNPNHTSRSDWVHLKFIHWFGDNSIKCPGQAIKPEIQEASTVNILEARQ